jgi:predicted membrane-bound spermidine synthase
MLHVTVFVSSGCVMVIELVAGRIVSRHLGASLYTWTSVIGVILGGLAIGNYIGGRLADRWPGRRTLGVLFVLSSATCVAVSVANNVVGDWAPLWSLTWPARVALHVTLVFFLPSALLGTIGPVVARMALSLGRETGRTLGSIYAWGVVGSIAGTFATGYLLIDLMGTHTIVWSVGGLLAVAGIVCLPRFLPSWGWVGLFLVVACLALTPWSWARRTGERLALRETADPTVIYRDESRYSHVEVRRLQEDPDVRGLYLDKLLHSRVSMDEPLDLQYGYVRIFDGLTRCWAGDRSELNTLTIGGGGYVWPRALEAGWPEGRIDVVEIDPAVTRAAALAFGLPADSAITSHHEDGRVHVNRLAAGRREEVRAPAYDFVYLDAVNDYSVPFQLTTREFFENLRSVLADDGVVMVNLIDLLGSGRLLGALANTMAVVFPRVEGYALGDPDRIMGNSRMTFVLIGHSGLPDCSSRFEVAEPTSRPTRLDDARMARYRRSVDGLVLTDSYAPVEQLVSPVVLASSRELGAVEALRRAMELARQGDLDGYVASCRRAVELDPERAEAHYNFGVGLHRQGRAGEARDHWRRAIELRADYAEAHHNLGASLYAEGDLRGSLRHLSEAARLRPDSEEIERSLGVVLMRLGEAESDISGEFAGLATADGPTRQED